MSDEIIREMTRNHAAALAEKDAEIERLREAVDHRNFLMGEMGARIAKLEAALRLIADPGDVTTPEELGYIASAAIAEADNGCS